MNCRSCQKQIERYLDNELGASDRAEVEAHLLACSGCRQLFDELARVQNLLRDSLSEPDESYWHGFVARFWDEWQKRQTRSSSPGARRLVGARPVPVWIGLAAAAVLVLAIGLVGIRSYLAPYRAVKVKQTAPVPSEAPSLAREQPRKVQASEGPTERPAVSSQTRGARQGRDKVAKTEAVETSATIAPAELGNAPPVPCAVAPGQSARAQESTLVADQEFRAGQSSAARVGPDSIPTRLSPAEAFRQAVRTAAAPPPTSIVGTATRREEQEPGVVPLTRRFKTRPGSKGKGDSGVTATKVEKARPESVPPQVTEAPELIFLPEASEGVRRSFGGQELTVLVTVESDGSVSEAQIHSKVIARELSSAVLDMARKARFRPGRAKGRPVRGQTTVVVKIPRLPESDKKPGDK